jgi:copper homeostasis protein CutC
VAAERIEIMPGAGVNKDNVEALIRDTGAPAVHGSFSRDIPFRLTDLEVVKSVTNTLSIM